MTDPAIVYKITVSTATKYVPKSTLDEISTILQDAFEKINNIDSITSVFLEKEEE